MSSFTQPLTVTKILQKSKVKSFGLWSHIETKDYWIVEKGFRYWIGSEDGIDFIDVPAGFKTDFASVPRIFWPILPPAGPYTQAAVLHDYLYNQQKRPRAECDSIFREAMGVLGVPEWKRQTMYQAVNAFGWIPWKSKKRVPFTP